MEGGNPFGAAPSPPVVGFHNPSDPASRIMAGNPFQAMASPVPMSQEQPYHQQQQPQQPFAQPKDAVMGMSSAPLTMNQANPFDLPPQQPPQQPQATSFQMPEQHQQQPPYPPPQGYNPPAAFPPQPAYPPQPFAQGIQAPINMPVPGPQPGVPPPYMNPPQPMQPSQPDPTMGGGAPAPFAVPGAEQFQQGPAMAPHPQYGMPQQPEYNPFGSPPAPATPPRNATPFDSASGNPFDQALVVSSTQSSPYAAYVVPPPQFTNPYDPFGAQPQPPVQQYQQQPPYQQQAMVPSPQHQNNQWGVSVAPPAPAPAADDNFDDLFGGPPAAQAPAYPPQQQQPPPQQASATRSEPQQSQYQQRETPTKQPPRYNPRDDDFGQDPPDRYEERDNDTTDPDMRHQTATESPQAKYRQQLARMAPPGASPLPKAELVRKTGFVLARISFRTIVMKKWKQSFWVQYGPHTMLWFRTKSDFDDWLNNPYHTQVQRNFLIKLAVNFVHDLYKPNVRGYQVTQCRTKAYGNKMVRQFKLERWMDYGPTIAAAFGAYNPKEVDDLRDALVECMRNTPLNGGIRATGAVRQRSNDEDSQAPSQQGGGHDDYSQDSSYNQRPRNDYAPPQQEPVQQPPVPSSGDSVAEEADLLDMDNWDDTPSHAHGQNPYGALPPATNQPPYGAPQTSYLPQQYSHQQPHQYAMVPMGAPQAYPGAPALPPQAAPQQQQGGYYQAAPQGPWGQPQQAPQQVHPYPPQPAAF